MDASGHAPFVQAEYDEGVLNSTILDCPFGERGQACAISRHGLRERKTGPPHPIAILRCFVHQRFFSVYPPGFTPYARRQLIEGPAQHNEPALVEVVADAAAMGPVHREPAGRSSWSTQSRLVQRVSTLFALDDEQRRQTLSTLVGLPLIQLEAAALSRGIQARSRALMGLLERLSADDLLGLGPLAGLWGPAHRWCAHRQTLVPMGLSP